MIGKKIEGFQLFKSWNPSIFKSSNWNYFLKSNEVEFTQYLIPVTVGPSSNK